MVYSIYRQRKTCVFRFLSVVVLVSFAFSVCCPLNLQAQGLSATAVGIPSTVFNLPDSHYFLSTTTGYNPAVVKAMTIHPDNPFQFDFLIDPGDDKWEEEALRAESEKLAKYFLASLTIPEDQMWVNLSPYEKDRIVLEAFGGTEMGRDLLAQDYLLKQLSASLVYPEGDLGKQFWQRVYKKANEQFGATDFPTNAFNKIWIVPERATVYVHDHNVFVVDSHLKVMMEEDYVARKANVGARHVVPVRNDTSSVQFKEDTVESALTDARDGDNDVGAVREPPLQNEIASEIVREILIPQIEKEVNEGKTFANLRQIFHSMILAAWYKKNLKESLLSKVYVDQEKTKGVDIKGKNEVQKIYDQYVRAFREGVYDIIKEEYDPATQDVVPRRYMAGGVQADVSHVMKDTAMLSPKKLYELLKGKLVQTTFEVLNFSKGKNHLAGSVDHTNHPPFYWENEALFKITAVRL